MDSNSPSKILEPSQLFNILTLRYDTFQESNLPKLKWSDFNHQSIIPSSDKIEILLKTSIEKNLDEKKAGIALSGGIDSTLVLSLVRKFFPDVKIKAFSIQFSESIDETKTASKIAEHFEIEHEKIFLENYLQRLPKAISIVGLPFWDLHWFYVTNESKNFSSLLLSGDGGDELFGGYTFRYKKFLENTRKNTSPIEKIKNYLSCHERDFVPDQDKLFKKELNFSWDKIYSQLLPYFENSLSNLEQVFLADYNGKLSKNFSPINNKIINFFNMKSVTPILDPEIISYSTQIPHEYKYDSKLNIGKLPLRKLLEKFEVSVLLSNQKLGFSLNTVNLWKLYAYNLCKDFLLDSQISNEKWIDVDWITLHLKKELSDVRYINKFLGLLAIEIWYRLFVTKTLDPNTIL